MVSTRKKSTTRIGNVSTNNASKLAIIKPSPKKKKKPIKTRKRNYAPPRVKAGTGSSPKQIYYDVIMTESCVKYNEFQIVTVKQQNSGNGGYMHPLIQCINNKVNNEIGSDLVNSNKLDCCIGNLLYLRASHEDNSKVPIGFSTNKPLFCLGIVAMINKPKYKILGKTNTHIDFEKIFRDKCEEILVAASSPLSNKETKYVPWDPIKHSATAIKFNATDTQSRHLDMVFTNEGVDSIMMSYYFQKDFNRTNVYAHLKKNV
jgi:hypothetical protein